MVIIGNSIDIGSKSVKILVTLHEKGKAPQILVATSENSTAIQNGQIVNQEEALFAIKKAIDKTEKYSNKKIDDVVLGINSSEIKTKIIEIKNSVSKSSNEVTDLDIDKAYEQAKEKISLGSPYEIINIAVSKIYLDDKENFGNFIGKIANTIKFKFIIQVISKKSLEKFLYIFDTLKINVSEIIYSPYADIIPLTTQKERISGVCFVNIGEHNTSISIYENDMPVLTKIHNFGGYLFTNDIAIGLNLSIDESEENKKRNKTNNKQMIDNIILARIKDLAEIIKNDILKINKIGKLPGGVVISGGSSKIENIDIILGKELNMSVKNASNILAKITSGILKDSSFSTVYGLSFLNIDKKAYHQKIIISLYNFFKKIFKQILP